MLPHLDDAKASPSPRRRAACPAALRTTVKVFPTQDTSYASLEAIPGEVRIDIVDVFRNSSRVAPLVDPAIARRARFFWMQEGVIDRESARRLEEAGVGVAMDLCILKEHVRLPGRRP